ncbi:MAG: nitrilase-related carbon-nitrogen hydrolase [bacterium]|nr:nitrilase-related carbon-nitrogen hydrolase [bacterium]
MRLPAMVLPVLSAILGITAFSPLPYSWLAVFICLVPLILFYRRETRLLRLLAGTALFRLIFAAGVVYFAFEPFGWIASALLFLGLPISFHLIRRFAGPAAALTSFPILWTFWDLLEARYTFLPMYVMVLGNALAPSPFLGLASWGGFIGPTLFGVLINTLVAAAFLAKGKRLRMALAGASILLLAAGWFASRALLLANAREYAARPREIRIASLSTDETFDKPIRVFPSDTLGTGERIQAAAIINRLLAPIAEALEHQQSLDLVILPEDMIDLESWNDADPEAMEKFGIESGGVLIGAYRDLARHLHANLTATFTTIQDGKRYNTTLLFERSGALAGRYNKVRLTLGGEYWPFGNWRPFYWNAIARVRPEITMSSPLFDTRFGYTPGEPELLAADGFTFAAPICIEIHYPWMVRDLTARGASFIAHTANNRWVTIGFDQYLRLTNSVRRVEAVWLSMPIVIGGRNARAGLIGPDGRMERISADDRSPAAFIGTVSL